MTEATCSIEDCPKAQVARGMCSMHYARWSRHGDPNWTPTRVIKACKVDGCDDPFYGRGFCHPHYTRWRRFGEDDPRLRGEVRNGCKICTACGVDKPLSEYGVDKSVKTGLAIYCKSCNRAKSAAQPVDPIRKRERERSWCDRNPDHKLDSVNRTRAKRAGVGPGTALRSDVFRRDGWVCGICSSPIDPALAWPDPMSASLDHVMPISRGGDHGMDNCQASHLTCNLRKGARERRQTG